MYPTPTRAYVRQVPSINTIAVVSDGHATDGPTEEHAKRTRTYLCYGLIEMAGVRMPHPLGWTPAGGYGSERTNNARNLACRLLG